MESATSLIHLSSRAMSEPRSCGEDKPRDLVFFSQSTQPRNADYLSSAGLAGRYGNGRTWNLQKICEEFDAASLARPSTGGAIRESFSASPSSPVMAFFFARGWTLTAKTPPDSHSRIGIMEWLSPRTHRGSR